MYQTGGEISRTSSVERISLAGFAHSLRSSSVWRSSRGDPRWTTTCVPSGALNC